MLYISLNYIFSKKNWENVWWNGKNFVSLHRQTKTMTFGKRSFEIDTSLFINYFNPKRYGEK
jgi:hypothetical protein